MGTVHTSTSSTASQRWCCQHSCASLRPRNIGPAREARNFSAESDERARSRGVDVTPANPGDEHPAGGGMAQVDQVGQVRPFVQLDGAAILTICRNATVPSCMRVPPELGGASSGSRSGPAAAVVRPPRWIGPGSRTRRPPARRGDRTQCPRRSAPIRPGRRRRPVRVGTRRWWRLPAARCSSCGTIPSSSTASRSCRAPIRLTPRG